jgi:hypothetical protein
MTDSERDLNNAPAADPQPDGPAQGAGRGDERSDIEQVVAARSDAVARGEGGVEPGPMTSPGDYSGVSGDGGEVKDQGITQQ